MSEFSGAYAILYAFFDAEGGLDRAAMRRQVEASLAAGAHGIAALGLATEVAKLTREERHQIMDWVAEDVAGHVPVAFTIFGTTIEEQIAEAKRAKSAGAAWLIHQPPPK
ncbi:MAG TPA: dihydrodipicolinate synthase family protein, partial [Nordella sp.]|nr:dihydrodipicolinate synthase family protein [Nordella sp.]